MAEAPAPDGVDLGAALATQGPLSPAAAAGLVERGRELLGAGEPGPAALVFRRVIGFNDPVITAAAWLGLGDALFRLDAEGEALRAWESVVRLSETPSTYQAWRNIAAARVRAGDLPGALVAYREADRRAPAEAKAEIASRLGWLSKETGNQSAAGRYFARARGTAGPLGLAQVVLGVTIVVSLLAFSQPDEGLIRLLWLEHAAVASGELYRLLSVTLVHANFIHLFFNMYALYLLGPVVEGIWGTRLFGLFYLLAAAAASTASFALGPGPSVGASGAIFGLVGVLLAGTRVHHPVLDRRARAIVPQLGMIVVINLVFGFLAGGTIDNAAHIGGLLAGLWLGLVVPPGRVPTSRSAWQRPAGDGATTSPLLVAAGLVGLVGVIALGLTVGGATI
ncbi:MAG TPA: rhomboid family intramembrane serine protease [Candidatus Eisenbacteria bacterium]|nr:rhomboid family intramembrane serine protease [Candidatus Eisenbacteria bacterium]